MSQQEPDGDGSGHDGVVGGEGEVGGDVGQAQQGWVGDVGPLLGEEVPEGLVEGERGKHRDGGPARCGEVAGGAVP